MLFNEFHKKSMTRIGNTIAAESLSGFFEYTG